nr:MAG TPA: hypothetical protein [Caudoviricetes sp.]DAY07491.1 MAG TPA: hypothetical protein [Caudoviricetes sp.]
MAIFVYLISNAKIQLFILFTKLLVNYFSTLT